MTITVVTPAASTNLCSLANVKTLLGETTSDYDALLTRYITRASAAIVSHLGYPLGSQTVLETFAGVLGKRILLTYPKITAISSVTFKSVALDPTLYSLQDGASGILFKNSGWMDTGGDHLYAAQYTFGHVLPDDGSSTLPLDIEQAAELLTQITYSMSASSLSTEAEEWADIYKVEYGKSRGTNIINKHFTSEILGLLAPYRQRRV